MARAPVAAGAPPVEEVELAWPAEEEPVELPEELAAEAEPEDAAEAVGVAAADRALETRAAAELSAAGIALARLPYAVTR